MIWPVTTSPESLTVATKKCLAEIILKTKEELILGKMLLQENCKICQIILIRKLGGLKSVSASLFLTKLTLHEPI